MDETPAAVIDLAVTLRNIARAQGHLTEQGLAVRPHIDSEPDAVLELLQIEKSCYGAGGHARQRRSVAHMAHFCIVELVEAEAAVPSIR